MTEDERAYGRPIDPRLHVADTWPEYGLVRVLKFSDEYWPIGVGDLGWMSVEEYEAILYVTPAAQEIPYEPRPRIRKQPIPPDVRWQVWSRDDYTCQQCGAREHLSVDHIVPESKGGPVALDNLQTLCRRCNSGKRDRL